MGQYLRPCIARAAVVSDDVGGFFFQCLLPLPTATVSRIAFVVAECFRAARNLFLLFLMTGYFYKILLIPFPLWEESVIRVIRALLQCEV